MTAKSQEMPLVLLVEDEAMLRLVAAEALRDSGLNVQEAANGHEALFFLRSGANVSLLITDLRMPGMSGYEVSRAGSALRPNLKTMVITGYAPDPLPDDLLNAGVVIIPKPFDLDFFCQVAHEMLATSKV